MQNYLEKSLFLTWVEYLNDIFERVAAARDIFTACNDLKQTEAEAKDIYLEFEGFVSVFLLLFSILTAQAELVRVFCMNVLDPNITDFDFSIIWVDINCLTGKLTVTNIPHVQVLERF